MVLLTQSQVSIFISGVVIFLFTSALFLSGYVLQQKTVNNLRAQLEPQLRPLQQWSDTKTPSPSPFESGSETSTVEDVGGQSVPRVKAGWDASADEAVVEYIDEVLEEQREQHEKHEEEVVKAGPEPASEPLTKTTEDELSPNNDPEQDRSLEPPPEYDALSAEEQAHQNHIAFLSAPLIPETTSFSPAPSPKSHPSLLLQPYNVLHRLVQRWLFRITGTRSLGDDEDWSSIDESIPLEELSGKERRRRIKLDMRRLGNWEEDRAVEVGNVYRPRKRI